MKKKLETLDDFLGQLHTMGYTFVNNHDYNVPCVFVERDFFDEVLRLSYGKKMSVDVNLNIYDDGRGQVFVDVLLKFFHADIECSFLFDAHNSLDFFESLSDSGMLGLLPENSPQTVNVYFIQLPKKENAERALGMINEKLQIK